VPHQRVDHQGNDKARIRSDRRQGAMKAWEAQRQNFKRQLEASPWLKWAGLGIAGLLAVLSLQALDGWQERRQKAAIEAEQNLRRTLALKGQDAWLEREKIAGQLRDALRAQLPP